MSVLNETITKFSNVLIKVQDEAKIEMVQDFLRGFTAGAKMIVAIGELEVAVAEAIIPSQALKCVTGVLEAVRVAGITILDEVDILATHVAETPEVKKALDKCIEAANASM